MWLKLDIWPQFHLFYDIRGSMACFFVNTQPLKAIGTWNIITMTSQWARWRLKSSTSRLFTQMFIQAQIKENIKALHHWPFWAEFTGDRWIPYKKGQHCGKCLHLMTSSWNMHVFSVSNVPADGRGTVMTKLGSFILWDRHWKGWF